MLSIKPKTRKEIYMAYLAGDLSLELPEPLTRDEVNLYNLCKNRAYGEYTTVKEVLAECQPEYDEADEYFVLFENVPTIVEGETYIVNWNGTEYTCVAGGADGMVGLGDLTAIGLSGNGEPFCIVPQGSEAMMLMPFDGSTTLTISIRQEVTEVKKISGKFVEGMGYVEASETGIVSEQSVEILEGMATPIEYTGFPAIGDTVLVRWNGTEYICTAMDGGMGIVVGDGSQLGLPSNGEPFMFAFVEDGDDTRCVVNTEALSSVTVSVKKISETIHPIDQKFLRGTVIKVKKTESGYTCDEYTPAEIFAMLSEDITTKIVLLADDGDVKVALNALCAMNSEGMFILTFVQALFGANPEYTSLIFTESAITDEV